MNNEGTPEGQAAGGAAPRPPPRPFFRPLLAAGCIAAALLSACGGGVDPPSAATSDIVALDSQAGATPFIAFVRLRGTSLPMVTDLRFTVEPKPGAASKAVDVSYAFAALERRGYAIAGSDALTLPVFGLYAGHANRVVVQLQFADTSVQSLALQITTPDYVDPNAVYDRPAILKSRVAGSDLGFDFFAIKSLISAPVVIDTDGAIRWVGVGTNNSTSSTFRDNAFFVGEPAAPGFVRLELDGSVTTSRLIAPSYINFHHNIDPGKVGMLVEVDTRLAGVSHIESTLAEVTEAGAVIKEWDFAALLTAYMQGQGDDAAAFVRPGVDWFHINAATYDPRDDSVIASSRENFVIKVDYRTGEIRWIFGDPTKYWYTFPSLRAKALRLEGGGLYPIGQHATSLGADGSLILFNNGMSSRNQPAGAPQGEERPFSLVSAYTIDAGTLTAREVWQFDYGRTIRSPFCSSVYEASKQSLLINYSVAENASKVRVVGLDASRAVVFDFEYPTTGCRVSWNAIPVPLQGLTFR